VSPLLSRLSLLFDCSGLILWSWAQVGIRLPRVAAAQQAWATPIAPSQLKPGDLVFHGQPAYHLGMHLDSGLMINAPTPGANVNIVPVRSTNLTGFARVHR
jgi:cell wall-associated NlpC family hydrolase